jgi:hypothetical protein
LFEGIMRGLEVTVVEPEDFDVTAEWPREDWRCFQKMLTIAWIFVMKINIIRIQSIFFCLYIYIHIYIYIYIYLHTYRSAYEFLSFKLCTYALFLIKNGWATFSSFFINSSGHPGRDCQFSAFAQIF